MSNHPAHTEETNAAGEAIKPGRYLTKDTILEIYDALAESMKTSQLYQTRLDPPPSRPVLLSCSASDRSFMNTATLNVNLFTKSKSLGKLESAVEEEGMAFLRHALGALARLLLYTETTRRSVKLSCNSRCVNANQPVVGRLFHLLPGSIAFDLIVTQISRNEGLKLSEIAAKIHGRQRRKSTKFDEMMEKY